MKIRRFALIGLSILAISSFVSCSSEEPAPADNTGANPDGTYTVTLSVPTGALQTRANGKENATNSEASINDLWFCAFPETDGEKIITSLSATKIANTSTPEYDEFNITMKPGTYKVYVLANVNSYLTTPIAENSTSYTGASSIEGMVLDFTNKFNLENTKSGLKETNLPMVCLNKDIKTSKGGTAIGEDGTVEIGKEASKRTIVADMTLLCAKVRYTILFDQEDFSDSFKSLTNVDFNKAEAKNVRLNSNMKESDATNNSPTSFEVNLGRYVPTNAELQTGGIWDIYKNMQTSTTGTAPANFSTTATFGESHKKRVWQGTVYLPENLGTTKTTIEFDKKDGIGSYNDKNEPVNHSFTLEELNRGCFYDVVAKLTSPSEFTYEVTVYVKVLPWDYHSSGTVEW